MIKIKASLFFLMLTLLLDSCQGSVPASPASPTKALNTDLPFESTHIAETDLARPTGTPITTQLASMPGPFFTVIPPQSNEQSYIDPDGWYSVNFPADLKSVGETNSFAGQEQVFETGYLPYASNSMNLCLWIANIYMRPEQSSIQWQPPCSVSGTDGGYSVQYVVYENPLADPKHRFMYVKMGKAGTAPLPYIQHTVSWLKTTAETHFSNVPLNSEESSFWENPDTMLNETSITEYLLPVEAQIGPMKEMLLRYVSAEAQPHWAVLRREASNVAGEPTKEEQLKSLGYELKRVETPCCRQQLYRDGRPLFDNVTNISDVYRFSNDSGAITAFTVTIQLRDSFLILNDTINPWDYSPQDPGFAPVLYQAELLWAKGTQNSRVEVKRSNGDVLFTFETYFGTHLEVDRFQAWNEHWILTAGDFLIQDGEILNQTLGFQEIFEWSVVEDKPVFLFRRGSRLGLSYDGRFLLLPYEDIARGLCCGFASNNPTTLDDSIYFFGKRDGTWYYAVVKFR